MEGLFVADKVFVWWSGLEDGRRMVALFQGVGSEVFFGMMQYKDEEG